MIKGRKRPPLLRKQGKAVTTITLNLQIKKLFKFYLPPMLPPCRIFDASPLSIHNIEETVSRAWGE
jgi:hypothetical protein